MENTKDKQKSKPTQKPAHVVRRGAIAASIWRRQTQTGFGYYDYSLSRSWKTKDGSKEGYSSSFFTRNEAEMHEVIAAASKWITEQESTDSETATNEQEKQAA